MPSSHATCRSFLMMLLAGMAVIVATISAAEQVSSSTKLYGGRSLAAWKSELVDFDAKSPAAVRSVPALMAIFSDTEVDAITRRHAALALGNIGKPARQALPLLLQFIAAEDPACQDEAQWAIKAFSLMGPAARDATPALSKIVRDDQRPLLLRMMSVEALAVIGGAHPDAMWTLVEMLQEKSTDSASIDDQRRLRLATIEALSVAGSDAAVAAPLLIRIVRDPRESERARRYAVISLGKIGPSASVATDAIVETLLLDKSPAVRDVAAEALAKIGPKGNQALLRLVRHPDADCRQRAVQALGTVEILSLTMLESLQKSLGDTDDRVRLAAAKSIAANQRNTQEFLNTVVTLLGSQQREVRYGALLLLTSLDKRQARRALPALEKIRSSDRTEIRRIAAEAIERITAED